MENKPLVIALGILGIGLIAVAMVGVIYISKLDLLLQKQAQNAQVDWTPLERYKGQAVSTGGVTFTIKQVLYGAQVNPTLRQNVLASCRDEVVFRIAALNRNDRPVTLTPGVFRLRTLGGMAGEQNYADGFEQPILAAGEERAYYVGFMALTTGLPCALTIDGETLMRDAQGVLVTGASASYGGRIEVCPGLL